MKCASCKSELPDNVNICSNCGKSVTVFTDDVTEREAARVKPSVPPGVKTSPQAKPSTTPQAKSKKSPENSKSPAIVCMVMGIISFILANFSPFFITIAGIAFMIGITALKRKRPGKGMVIAGIVTSGISLLYALYLIVLAIMGSLS